MSAVAGINRIDINVPGTSSTAQSQRDECISKLISTLSIGSNYDAWRYSDTNSGLGTWAYYFCGYAYTTSGIMTVATVSCSGVAHPPSGSNLVAAADPGVGTAYTWGLVGALQSVRTSSGGGGGSVPQGNNNFYVWNISGNSSAAAADFTTAVNAVGAALASSLLGGAVQKQLLKYVDSVSGAWQVSAIFFGAGCAEFGTTSTVSVLPNNNILYVVTCSGTPNPPTGSSAPAVSIPSFTQSFTTITAPLSFGPMR